MVETRDAVMARPKASREPRRYGTLIRVSDPFAEAIRSASSFERMSIAEFADTVLRPLVEKRYREAVENEAKRLGGKV